MSLFIVCTREPGRWRWEYEGAFPDVVEAERLAEVLAALGWEVMIRRLTPTRLAVEDEPVFYHRYGDAPGENRVGDLV